jgi:hypothetical protein
MSWVTLLRPLGGPNLLFYIIKVERAIQCCLRTLELEACFWYSFQFFEIQIHVIRNARIYSAFIDKKTHILIWCL